MKDKGDLEKKSVWIIYNPEGRCVRIGFTKHDAWSKFFDQHAYINPLGEAIKAYEAIGFKAIEYHLITSDRISVLKEEYDLLKSMAESVDNMFRFENERNFGDAEDSKHHLRLERDKYVEKNFDYKDANREDYEPYEEED